MSISDNELIAVEPGSRINKTYKLDRIASVELANGQCATNPHAASAQPSAIATVPALNTLAEYIQHFRAELAGVDWYLYEEEDSFGIATRFKNGKPKKTPSVLIRYFDPTEEPNFDLQSGELKTVRRELTGRERPWRVDSWRFKEGKTFARLEHAFAVFLSEARASDPATAKTLWAGR